MFEISSGQLTKIKSIIETSRVTSQTLKDDLLDHLCCLVECKMTSGKPFELALQEALNELAPAGLAQIQIETDLLYLNSLTPMTKIMYATGLVTSMSFTMGLMMKLLHMPGGEQLVNYGFLGFALLFLPMVTIHRYRASATLVPHQKLKILFGFLSAVLTGSAVLLKMTMKLDVSEIMLITGASIFSFGFLPVLFFGMYKQSTLKSA